MESYLAVPHFVAGTDRIALMQERLAVPLARRMDLRVLNWRVPSGRTFATTPTVYPL